MNEWKDMIRLLMLLFGTAAVFWFLLLEVLVWLHLQRIGW